MYCDSSLSISSVNKWAAKFKRGNERSKDYQLIEKVHDMFLVDLRTKVREITYYRDLEITRKLHFA